MHRQNRLHPFYDPREHDACGVGFLARLDAAPTHRIVEDAVTALGRMKHRGGSGCGPRSADGAGIMFPLPHAFMRGVWADVIPELPDIYGVGQLFLPQDADKRKKAYKIVEEALESHGFTAAGRREVPVRSEMLRGHALAGMPCVSQVLALGKGERAGDDGDAFERGLYVARRHMEKLAEECGLGPDEFHAASFSSRSIVYKGMLPGGDLAAFYPDLARQDFTAYYAIFHERYSTNTSPSWRLAQPFRCLAHNGEINTLRSNQAAMEIRGSLMASPRFGADMKYVLPVLDHNGSDSAMLDNAMELLLHGGRTLAHSAMMLMPEPFGSAFIMGEDKRAFYEYHAALMEPWDGPSALVFTDGAVQIGAMLDRNALRPCRYLVTKDDTVLLASEAGVLDIPDNQVARRGRLKPRRMLLVDFARHRVVTDAECKNRVIYAKPYRHWVREHGVSLKSLPKPVRPYSAPDRDELLRSQKLFGYTREDVKDILLPMTKYAQEPVASMGTDTPLAVLSQKPQLLFSYLKQRFAQVTNPPIDPLREGLVMTLSTFVGPQGNILAETPEQYSRLRLRNPLLFPQDMDRLTASEHPAVRVRVVPMLFDVPGGPQSVAELEARLEKALDEMCATAEEAVDGGCTVIMLSDAGADAGKAPIPSLLGVSALHRHLIRQGKRHACGIMVDTGEAREVMQIAQLAAFGAGAVYPRVAFAVVDELADDKRLGDGVTRIKARGGYARAVQKGLLKTFSRMGISTLRSFNGGQAFEALGLSKKVVDKYFEGLPSRLGGIGLGQIARDVLARHRAAYPESTAAKPVKLEEDGRFRYRKGGETHLWTPDCIRSLHQAVRHDDEAAYAEYAAASDNQGARPVTLRGLLRFKSVAAPVPLHEVEPESAIMRRFVGAAMSYGSISLEAHEAVAVAFNRVGGRSNCGEGGELPERLVLLPNGDSKKSRIRQVASGRFGVTADYLVKAEEIQIKLAQGAKPGEGGQLPAHKVLPEIARVRRTMPGVTLISPPPHHDIYSIEDLAQLIYDLKRLNREARISVKLVAGTNVGTIASGVAKAGADLILVSGHDGGTGASPRSAISYVGLPWEMGLVEAHAALTHNNLRCLVTLQTDGQLRTGRDLAVAALLGAEEFGLGTSLLVALGCCMLRVCHLGTCPTGIATQDCKLRARQKGAPEHVERFLRFLAGDLRRHMAALGFRKVDEMVGRSDLLEPAPLPDKAELPVHGPEADAWLDKVGSLDLGDLLTPVTGVEKEPEHCGYEDLSLSPFADTGLQKSILEAAAPALEQGRPVRFEGRVRNIDRAVCTRLSGEICRKYGEDGLTPGAVEITLHGTAGQSAGAFLARGVRLLIKGEANDYVGKGLSGGVIAVAPALADNYAALSMYEEQAAIGNVALYGATSGELYVAGSAGERFAVRNSGALAVVEGIGDHGCEYMTGGVVVVLGTTGYNFAAGMSGGTAYVYDRSEMFQTRCNLDGIDIASVWQSDDVRTVRGLLEKHLQHTGSPLARYILDNWATQVPLFLKITPLGHERTLERMKQSEDAQADNIAATEEVFHP